MKPTWMTVLVTIDEIDTFAHKLIFFALQLIVSFWINKLFRQIKMQFSCYNNKLIIVGIWNFNIAYWVYEILTKNLALSDSYLKKTFFFHFFLKVVVIFESKIWIGLYLKVPPKVRVYYVIFSFYFYFLFIFYFSLFSLFLKNYFPLFFISEALTNIFFGILFHKFLKWIIRIHKMW